MEDDNQFDNFLRFYGDAMVKALRYQLLFVQYPYAPGRNDQRQPFGVANKVADTKYGYDQSLVESIQANYRFEDGEVDILMNDYWVWVNQGRDPGHYVPITPLQMWAKSRLGLDDKDARSMAFGVSKNIFRYGIKPTYFFDNAVDEVNKLMKNREEQMAQDINSWLTTIKLINIPVDTELTIGL
tara:strand:- start:353 stop:904 length:552 start_codon:yes stop_codon:yes gene_type:complete